MDPSGFVWAEANFVLKKDASTDPPESNGAYVPLLKNEAEVAVGPEDTELDFVVPPAGKATPPCTSRFSRQEYHLEGKTSSIVSRHWGCHMTDSALKRLVKNLDGRGIRERQLKNIMKNTIETIGQEKTKEDYGEDDEDEDEDDAETQDKAEEKEEADDKKREDKAVHVNTSGDESHVASAKALFLASSDNSAFINTKVTPTLDSLSTAVGQRVRVREVVHQTKDTETAAYNNGTVVGWTVREEEQEEAFTVMVEGDAETEFRTVTVQVPVWKVVLDHGEGEEWVRGNVVVEIICRYIRWISKDSSYVERDASFLAYRNSLGRHCGKAADAGVSATPSFLGRTMIRREQELYTPLKSITYDNSWGGKNGNRNAWINSMKEYCYDFASARNGLLTLEEALFELTGQFSIAEEEETTRTAEEVLNDASLRIDIELESIEKGTKGLWNSRESRQIFRHIVEQCTTTAVLALALDLLCRNTHAYLETNKPARSSSGRTRSAASENNYAAYAPPPMRMTRRMNAWQQANEENWY